MLLALTVIFVLLHGDSAKRLKPLLTREEVRLDHDSNYSGSMWDGQDVELIDTPDKLMKKSTPIPSFVSLVWQCDSGNQVSVEQCGGILYKRKYVITAAHCLQNFDKCSMKAYLNPYRSPFVKQMVDTRTFKRREQVDFLEAFQDDAKNNGLGIALPAIKAVFQHQGWLAEYKKVGDKAPHDIAIVQLEGMPSLPPESPAWGLLDQKPFSESSHVIAGALYGFGDNSDKSCAGFTDINCFLQKKSVSVLPYEDCMKIEVEIAHFTIDKILSHLKENGGLGKLGKQGEEVIELTNKLREALDSRSKAWETYWNSHEESSDKFAEVKASADVFSKVAVDAVIRIQEIVPSPTLQVFALHEVREKRQVCIYSPTGVQREGDSGGPLVDESHQLIGVSSWAQSSHEPLAYASPRWTEGGGPFDKGMMPGFYVSVEAYKTDIDDLLKCLILEGIHDSKCIFGPAPSMFPMMGNLVDKGRKFWNSLGK